MHRKIENVITEIGAWLLIAGLATLALQVLRVLPAVWLPL